MLSTDREAFDAQLAVLFGGFPKPFLTDARKEAYWRGLQKMPLPLFTRVVDEALADGGVDEVPSINGVWNISRSLRRRSQPAEDAAPKLKLSDCHAYGNRALYWWLWTKGAATAASMQKILAAKDRLCDAYDSITSEYPEESVDLRDKLFAAWESAWEPATPDELQAAYAKFSTVGHV